MLTKLTVLFFGVTTGITIGGLAFAPFFGTALAIAWTYFDYTGDLDRWIAESEKGWKDVYRKTEQGFRDLISWPRRIYPR